MKRAVRALPVEDIQRRLGRAIRSARTANTMTQEELARRSGIGWRHFQKIEAGEVNTTLRTICRVASVLGVDPGALLRDTEV